MVLCDFVPDIHSEKMRKSYSILLQQHRAAILIQKHQKRRIATNSFIIILRASVAVQSGILDFFPFCNDCSSKF